VQGSGNVSTDLGLCVFRETKSARGILRSGLCPQVFGGVQALVDSSQFAVS
jgi:hypothetical protein